MYSLIIVEDEAANRQGLVNYFPWNECGFTVCASFPDGESAISHLSSSSADVLLTDIMMPGMTGIELIGKAKELWPGIVPVVLTGYSDFGYAKRCISLGVREYILKPAGYQDLMDVFTRIRAELDAKDRVDRKSPSETTEMMKRYISDHLDTVSLKELSDRFSLNQYYISELFSANAGTGFQEYTQNERMNKAAELLRGTNLGINLISGKVGYSSPSSFTRSFRAKFGQSPREYREKNAR